MPTEFITLTVLPGRRDDFLARIAEVGPAYLAHPGVQNARFFTPLDATDTVLGVIDWAAAGDIDDALATPAGQTFLATIGPLLAAPPAMRLADPLPAS